MQAAAERQRASAEYWGDDPADAEGILPLRDGEVVRFERPGKILTEIGDDFRRLAI